MSDPTEIIRDYYDKTVETEWNRIAGRPEFILSCRFLDKYIKPGQTVLDIGGGPGRYSMYLAKKGCRVTLLDLSPENVAFARAESARQELRLTCLCGDACKADTLLSEPFDHVLLMGPLYHLLEEGDRVQAVKAALALLKEGGVFFASFINLIAGIIYGMKFDPPIILEPAEQEFHETFLRREDFAGDAFTRAFFIRQEAILPFMEQFPLRKLHLFGQEGISSPCEENLMSQAPEVVEKWMDLCMRCCEREDLLSWSEHLMYVGQKCGSLQLVFPRPDLKEAALRYRQECFDNGEFEINGDGGLDHADSYEAWLLQIQADLTRDEGGFVPATTYFALMDGEVVGTLQIRHKLNDYLLNQGGHIGYGVAPSKRRQGIATAMLRQALVICDGLEIHRVLITCDRDNIASAKTIEKGGGIFENEFLQVNGNIVKRYWVDR